MVATSAAAWRFGPAPGSPAVHRESTLAARRLWPGVKWIEVATLGESWTAS